MMMKKKKRILMAALVMAVVSLTTSCNATGEEAGTMSKLPGGVEDTHKGIA